MATITIRKQHADSVSVKLSRRRDVELRIGPPEQGKTRFAVLRPSEAREIAFALLLLAETADQQQNSK